MSDNEEAASLAQMRTVRMHTGEQFESGEVHRRRGLNEPAPGVVPDPAGPDPGERQQGARAQPAQQAQAAQSRMDSFFGKRTTEPNTNEEELVGAAGRKRAKKTKELQEKVVRGKTINIHVSDNVVEDPAWVVITAINNGNNHYLCVRCGETWWGHDGRVIFHGLRIMGHGVLPCKHSPTDRQKIVLERAYEAKQAGGQATTRRRRTPRAPSGCVA
jgi:hypothetical protein